MGLELLACLAQLTCHSCWLRGVTTCLAPAARGQAKAGLQTSWAAPPLCPPAGQAGLTWPQLHGHWLMGHHCPAHPASTPRFRDWSHLSTWTLAPSGPLHPPSLGPPGHNHPRAFTEAGTQPPPHLLPRMPPLPHPAAPWEGASARLLINLRGLCEAGLLCPEDPAGGAESPGAGGSGHSRHHSPASLRPGGRAGDLQGLWVDAPPAQPGPPLGAEPAPPGTQWAHLEGRGVREAPRQATCSRWLPWRWPHAG